MSKRDRGIAWYSRHEVLEGTQGLPLPLLLSHIERGPSQCELPLWLLLGWYFSVQG